ncbi:Ig-like domain-containing protein [Spirochaeta lutea]|uniref:Ig-like domain-containing protein n=1 Tax=Spirochaeta lutea TaxID=1480694 RepID=UPI00068D6C2B|nr:Ig-like domain-containing protein [Spirochaeta lutea]
MKKNGRFAVLVLAVAALLTACPGVGPDPGGDDPGDLVKDVTAVSITASGTLTLEMGKTLQLTYTVTPEDATSGITWTSSDQTVATVNETGLVTPKKEGTATITLASTKDPSIKAQATVQVVAAGGVQSIADDFFLYNQASVGEGTTPELPGLLNYALTLVNTSEDGMVKDTLTKNSFILFKTPVTGEFTIQARVHINEPFGPISSNRGVTLGAYAETASGEFGDATALAAMFYRTRGDVRPYYTGSLGTNSAGSPNLAQTDDAWQVERILEVSRTADGYSFRILASKDASEVAAGSLSAAELSDKLTGTAPVYLGLTANGADVTFSNIKIYTGSGENQTLEFETQEIASSPVAVSGVAIDGPAVNANDTYDYQNSLEAAQADTIQLTAAVSPEHADNTGVTWSSSDEAVATVSGTGLVTVQGAGTAVITVTTVDKGFIDTYDLNISAETILVDSLTISGETSVMKGLTTTLTATASPDNATDQSVTWSSDAPTIASVDAETGVVTGISLGTASITATATDAGGASQSVTVTVTESETLIWNWNSAGPHFDMTSGAVTFDGKTMVSRGGSKTPEVDGSFILSDGRFNIGSATLDTTLATAADVNVDDGEFNFTSTAKIVLTYSAYSNTDGKTDGFRFYLNNNTTSESKSVLYRAADELADPPVDKISPILSPDAALSEAGGTVEYLIDPVYFEQNSESLANAFIQLRADSKTSITITAISIEYVND